MRRTVWMDKDTSDMRGNGKSVSAFFLPLTVVRFSSPNSYPTRKNSSTTHTPIAIMHFTALFLLPHAHSSALQKKRNNNIPARVTYSWQAKREKRKLDLKKEKKKTGKRKHWDGDYTLPEHEPKTGNDGWEPGRTGKAEEEQGPKRIRWKGITLAKRRETWARPATRRQWPICPAIAIG